MEQFNDLKIVGDVRNTKVFLDGVEVKGVREVKFEKSWDGAALLSLEMYVGTHEISISEEKNDGK